MITISRKHTNQYGKLQIFACQIQDGLVSITGHFDNDQKVNLNCFKELILKKINGDIVEKDLNKMIDIYIEKLDKGELLQWKQLFMKY